MSSSVASGSHSRGKASGETTSDCAAVTANGVGAGTGRRSPFLIETHRSSKSFSADGCGATECASRKGAPAAIRMIDQTAAAAARILLLVISTPTQPTEVGTQTGNKPRPAVFA